MIFIGSIESRKTLMSTIHDILANENFIGPIHVEGREAIANLFPLDKRCGIYVLHFANSMAYVGQSVDVTRRYIEHRRNHNDIVEMSFKQIKRSDLDLVEKFTRYRSHAQGRDWGNSAAGKS